MGLIDQKWRIPMLVAALGLLVLLTFARVTTYDFVRYDDPTYVTENPHIAAGVTAEGITWAFTSGYASNWHPVTWLSHMLDVQLFGLRPGWHHLVSVCIHAVNTVLLFLLLVRFTRFLCRSAVIAALFAVHPLHVESVAWVSERKDVLSTLFLVLTIWAYAEYVARKSTVGTRATGQQNSRGRSPWRAYALALAFFALGLMSKPMLVTGPFLLLLLDFWPLGRYPAADEPGRWRKVWLLIREKLPFASLAAFASFVTYAVQASTHAVILLLPLHARLLNSVASYIKYLAKAFWPARLAVFYPHPDTRWPVSEQWSVWVIALAALGLVVVSLAAWLSRRRAPWLFTGWFWYLGTLVPVIGIIQVGGHAIADRYTYVPLLGVFICFVWGMVELARTRSLPAWVPSVVSGLAILGSVAVTSAQIPHWRNDVSLFQHALAVTGKNAVAHVHLGIYYGDIGKFDLALDHFRAAIADAPALADGYSGIGYTLELQGRTEEALPQYRMALQLAPWDHWSHYRLGAALSALGRKEEGLKEYQEAVRYKPDSAQNRYALGSALADLGREQEAAVQLAQAVRLEPTYARAILRLAEVLLNLGKPAEAEARFRQLVTLDPKDPDAHINLGGVLWMTGKRQDAFAEYAAAVAVKPDYPVAHFNLATALFSQHRFAEAEQSFAKAASLKPDYVEAITGVGRALAAQGKLESAITAFERALAVRRNAFTVYNLGLARVARGELAPAMASLREALQLRPEWPPALSELASLLAAAPDPGLRNGIEALQLANRAVELTGGTDPAALSALDMAYAEAGRFDEAAATAEKVKDLALRTGAGELAKAAEDRLARYRTGQPFHRAAPQPGPY